MATVTTTLNVWQDFAILSPTSPQFNKKGEPVQWKVQINQHGTFRCSCPSYIFSGKGGKVRECKHTRRCQQEVGSVTPTTVPLTVTAKAPAPAKPPTWDSAYAITSAMLDDARVYVNDTQRQAMVRVLAAKLVAFGAVPVRPTFAPAVPAAVGVRYISFDE